jgi:hypothetical protein
MLFVGDDWAEDHHDIEIVDERGRRSGLWSYSSSSRVPRMGGQLLSCRAALTMSLKSMVGPDPVA